MSRKTVDNSDLERWRDLPAATVLVAVTDYAKLDADFQSPSGSTLWHVAVGSVEYEIVCQGPKFFDTRAKVGGGGAVDLTMHLHGVGFKAAALKISEAGL